MEGVEAFMNEQNESFTSLIEYHRLSTSDYTEYCISMPFDFYKGNGNGKFFYYPGLTKKWKCTSSSDVSWRTYLSHWKDNMCRIEKVSRLEVLVVCGSIPSEEEIIEKIG